MQTLLRSKKDSPIPTYSLNSSACKGLAEKIKSLHQSFEQDKTLNVIDSDGESGGWVKNG